MGNSFKQILKIGLPNAFTKAIVPVGTYIVTALLAVYGEKVVAGYGAGVKTEFVALCVVLAIASVMISFIGQNFGAGKIERIQKGFGIECTLNFV